MPVDEQQRVQWIGRVPVQNDEMAWRVVDDECIIVDPQGSQATVLNSVGARIWELIDGKRTLEAIVGQIVSEYAVDGEQAKTDALAFVDDLIQRELIRLD